MVITIDIQTVFVQGVGTQQGDTMGQLTELLVQFFSIQPRARGVWMIGADGIHSSCCSIFFSPEQGQSAARVQRANTGIPEQEAKQAIQGPFSGVELHRTWVLHVWGAEQVGNGEVEGKWHQGWTHTCRAGSGRQRCRESWRECGSQQSAGGGDPVLMVITIDTETVPVQGVRAQPSDTMGLLA